MHGSLHNGHQFLEAATRLPLTVDEVFVFFLTLKFQPRSNRRLRDSIAATNKLRTLDA